MRRKVMAALACVGMFAAAFAATAPAASASDDCGITVVGTHHADRIVGTDCDDVLYGLGGNDTIRAKLGEDAVYAGRGDDFITDSSTLAGGFIRGGRGWDTCVVPRDSDVQLFSCERIEEL